MVFISVNYTERSRIKTVCYMFNGEGEKGRLML